MIKMEYTTQIPDGVQVSVSGTAVSVKGPRGGLERDFGDPRYDTELVMSVSGDKFSVKTESKKRNISAMAGTIAGHVKNMCIGVTKGYMYTMKIIYSHFPITVSVKDGHVEVKNFLSEKGVRRGRIMGDCEVKFDKESVTITGNDLENVSQTTANIEQSCRLTRRDRRIFIDGIYVSGKMLATGEKI